MLYLTLSPEYRLDFTNIRTSCKVVILQSDCAIGGFSFLLNVGFGNVSLLLLEVGDACGDGVGETDATRSLGLNLFVWHGFIIVHVDLLLRYHFYQSFLHIIQQKVQTFYLP